MVREILTWWLEQLATLLPRGLRARQIFTDAVVLRLRGASVTAGLRRRGAETPLGPLDQPGVLRRVRGSRAGPIVLALPPGALLQHVTTLPLAAERDVQAVLGHEMDRLTPFAARDLYWTWRIESRDRAGGQLRLRLLLVPKTAVAGVLSALAGTGLQPVAIEIPAGGSVETLSLQPRGGRTSSRMAAMGAATCAGLAAALLVLPVIRQERAIAAAEDRVEALRPQVALADGLRRRIASSGGGASLFATEAARVGSALHAIAAVTDALPDDAYLTNFALRERKLSLSGRSASAAGLIPALSANPALRDPAFDAPVTRIGDKSDLFSLRATLAP